MTLQQSASPSPPPVRSRPLHMVRDHIHRLRLISSRFNSVPARIDPIVFPDRMRHVADIPSAGAISACPSALRPAHRPGTSLSCRPPDLTPRPPSFRLSSLSRRLALPCNAKTPRNVAPRTDEWLRKSSILDRDLACLTPHSPRATSIVHKTECLKSLFAFAQQSLLGLSF